MDFCEFKARLGCVVSSSSKPTKDTQRQKWSRGRERKGKEDTFNWSYFSCIVLAQFLPAFGVQGIWYWHPR